MAKTFDLSVLFKVVDRASEPFDKIGRAVERVSNKMQNAKMQFQKFGQQMTKFGNKAKNIGKNLSTKLSLPIAVFGALTVRTVYQFEQSMNKVSAVSGATGEDLKRLRDRAKEMGEDTQFSASEAADAMTFLAMAGLKTEQIYNSLPGVLQLAAAGGLDLASAADIATNVMTASGKSVKDLAHINNVLAYTANNANTDVRQLAEAMRPVISTADSLGISLEQTTAMLAKMADAGEKGGIAGTLLRNAMLALVKATPKSRAALEGMGIDINDFVDESGKIKNFEEMIEKIRDSGASAGEIFKAFGERGARAILLLTKKGKDLKKFTKELENSQGAANKAAKAMMKGLPGAFKELKSKFEGFLITLSESGLGEMLEKFIRGLSKVIKKISEFAKAHPGIMKVIGVLAILVAAIGPLILVIGVLSTAMGVLTAVSLPLLLVLGAIAALAFVIISNWGPITKFFKKIGDNIMEIFSGVADFFSGIWDIIVGIFYADGDRILKGMKKMVGGVENILDGLGNVMINIFDGIMGMMVDNILGKGSWDKIKKSLSEFGEWFQSFWSDLGDWLIDVWNDIMDSIPDAVKSFLGIPSYKIKVEEKKVAGKETIKKKETVKTVDSDKKGLKEFAESFTRKYIGTEKEHGDKKEEKSGLIKFAESFVQKRYLKIDPVQVKKVDMEQARTKKGDIQKSEADIRVKMDMPKDVTGTIISKKEKGEGTKVKIRLNNTFSGPTMAGVE